MSMPLKQAEESIASLHRGIVFELQHRLAKALPEEASDPAARQAVTLEASISAVAGFAQPVEAVQAAIVKINAMRDCLRQHEETIHMLRRRCTEVEHERQNDRRNYEELEQKYRQEFERAKRADRIVELLEQRNARFESDSEILKGKLECLIGAIDRT